MLDFLCAKRRRSLLFPLRLATLALLGFGLAVSLSACGKKPADVDAPAGASAPFPRTYPDLSTDPKS